MHSTEWGRCGQKHARWKCAGQSGVIRDVEEGACSAADRVICVSNVLKEEVQMLYRVPPAKLRTIYNGIHTSQYESALDPGQVKRSLGMDWFNPMVLYVGRLATQKGPDILLEAVPAVIQNVTEARFVFVGSGHMLPDLQKRAAALGVGRHVQFLGAKSGEELRALQRACDCMVVPSRNEPFGIVVLECWASGKPVIATTSGGPREFVADGEEGYLTDPEPGNISAAVVRLFSNWTLVAAMGARGRAKCAAEFSWDGIAAQTEAAYAP
uniref:Glycosyl transferase family 1 domain-containing protein n=1 Tax=Cryptomonas curvata TaxID=233186 RepID=A0A7S0QJR8_9CRYP|mmetsp:Transcript_34460/g.72338  ORF Transcript_34460/g.72338 Transcript_34460/m.72338 type:complete len:268 (+) Transcript_34460:1-804(+)